jgi:pyruvate/2-oxoglutarate/acetoin dehydrogenase E1 component
MAGMRPIAEIMYVDFTPLAMDQIANQGAKNRYMFGGKTTVPMVIRTEGGAGRSIAAHHSQSLEALWTHFPGVYVVMPSTPFDAKGLLKAAIRDDNPVMFIEHKMIYNNEGYVPDEDYVIPFGVADVKREGSDVTLVANGFQYKNAVAVADKLAGDISVEIVDPRSLSPLDMDTILKSLEKTNRLVIVDESWDSRSTASQIAAQAVDEGFDLLDAPVKRVCIPDIPIPGGHMEPYVAPNPDAIEAAVREVCR